MRAAWRGMEVGPLPPPDQSSQAAVGNAAPNTPFSCNVCKKSYSRIDHLARHFRSHSRERPYGCQICSKTFARMSVDRHQHRARTSADFAYRASDLLKRHESNHGPTPDKNADGQSAKRRKASTSSYQPRAAQACRSCAESKLKCDGTLPCSRCQDRQTVCQFPEPRIANSAEPQRAAAAAAAVPPPPAPESMPLPPPTNITPPAPSLPDGLLEMTSDHQAEATFVPNMNPTSNADDMSSPVKKVQSLGSEMYEQDMMVSFEDLPDLYTFGGPVATFPTLPLLGLEGGLDDCTLPRDALDFGFDIPFESPAAFRTEYMFPPHQFLPRRKQDLTNDEAPINPSGLTTPGLREKVNIRASIQAFKESLWLWTPQIDDHGAAEQNNLSLSGDNVLFNSSAGHDFPLLRREATSATRGKILAEVLSTCDAALHAHVISNFPSAELLTNLIHNFVAWHLQQDMMWIHLASIDINKEPPEFLMSMIAAGAVVSSCKNVRKLGFAIQEGIREAQRREFERDNRRTRDLRSLQSFLMALDIGLWSGDQRKMEISESFAMPILTMVRRAGHFRFQKAPELCPQEVDEGPILESKWRSWLTHESFKRLALYLFYRDTRSSMSLLTAPLVSYAEVATSLPCHKNMWLAKTASEWKQAYLALNSANSEGGTIQTPSIRACMNDSTPIFENQNIVDVETSLLLVNAAVWPLIWQFREMKSVSKLRTSRDLRHNLSTMNSRLHEVTQLLSHIQLSSSEWVGPMEPAAWLLQEQCLMHLYASLEDIQVLAGREGEEEARRVFPTLTAWVDSTEAREALFHAGQVIRAARMYQKHTLRDSIAVAVYHASLVLWVYSVLSRTQGADTSSQAVPMTPLPPNTSKLVRLDGESTPEVQRFVTFGKGVPCIGMVDGGAAGSEMSRDVLLKDTAEVMVVITRMLRTPYDGEEESCPPLLENLSKLIEALGKAAVRRRPREREARQTGLAASFPPNGGNGN